MKGSGSSMASSAICDVNFSSSMSASFVMLLASSAMSDVNVVSSMSASALMASSAFDALTPSKDIADVNSLLRCLQLMLDAIFSCCYGLMAADVNSSLRFLPARHGCTDGHCTRPLDLLECPQPVVGFGMK